MKRIIKNVCNNKSLLVLGSVVLSIVMFGNRASALPVPAFTISSGTSWVVSGSMQVVFNNVGYTNNGSASYDASSKVILASTIPVSIKINGINIIPNLEIQGNYVVGTTSTDSLIITGILKKTSGTLSTSNKLTLISNATGSAMIDDEGGVLSGKAYIQHYTSGAWGYHQFSTPVSGTTVMNWSNSFPIFGQDSASACTPQWGSLQYYDETRNNTSLSDSGFYNYTALSNPLVPGQGYTAWLNSLPTLNTFGTPNNGSITYPVTNSNIGIIDNQGLNLVGNPYPSPISWTSLKALNPGLFADQSCYLWQSSGGLNGTWITFDGTTGANGGTDVINSSQGFFVFVNATGTLNFDNTVRTYNYLSPMIFGASSNPINTLRLSISEPASKVKDEVVAYTNYKEGYSKKMVQPVGATNPTIAFEVKGTRAAIDVLNNIDSKTELPLVISTPNAGSYTLAINTNNIDLPVYLKDAVTGTYTDLKATPTTTITTSNKETKGRYSVVFSAKLTTNNSPLTTFPNPAKSSVTVKGNHIAFIEVVDNLGRVVNTVSLKDATNPTLSVNGLAAGTYHLRIQTTDTKVSAVSMIKE